MHKVRTETWNSSWVIRIYWNPTFHSFDVSNKCLTYWILGWWIVPGLRKLVRLQFDFLTMETRLRRGNLFSLLIQEGTISSGYYHIACFRGSYQEREHGVLFKDEKQTENNLSEKCCEEIQYLLKISSLIKIHSSLIKCFTLFSASMS